MPSTLPSASGGARNGPVCSGGHPNPIPGSTSRARPAASSSCTSATGMRRAIRRRISPRLLRSGSNRGRAGAVITRTGPRLPSSSTSMALWPSSTDRSRRVRTREILEPHRSTKRTLEAALSKRKANRYSLRNGRCLRPRLKRAFGSVKITRAGRTASGFLRRSSPQLIRLLVRRNQAPSLRRAIT
jgi:hypothetical protein